MFTFKVPPSWKQIDIAKAIAKVVGSEDDCHRKDNGGWSLGGNNYFLHKIGLNDDTSPQVFELSTRYQHDGKVLQSLKTVLVHIVFHIQDLNPDSDDNIA